MKGCKDMTPRVDTLHAMDARRLAEEKRRESHPPSTTRPQPEPVGTSPNTHRSRGILNPTSNHALTVARRSGRLRDARMSHTCGVS